MIHYLKNNFAIIEIQRLRVIHHQSQSQSQLRAFGLETGSDPGQGGNRQRILGKLLPCYARLPLPLQNTLKWMSENFEIESNLGRGLYIAAYMIVILMYPFHYYAYVIKQDQNCLEIDNELYATIAAVVFFNAYMLLYTPNFLKKVFAPGHGHYSKTAIGHFICTQIPVLLMTLTVIPDLTTGTTDKIFLTTANLFLFGYILLVIGLSLTIKYATEGTGYLAHAKWANAVYNLFLYLLGGHVFGALWYSFAVDRILACWREDYFATNKFNPRSFVCRDKHKNIGELNCPRLTKIASEISGFGIFEDALKSGVVHFKRQFLKKFLYCLRWGLQALRNKRRSSACPSGSSVKNCKWR
ncbi:hypothetical protein Pint_11101 [Pistacia integerrima]|uniref:Uncharacterized protein n=1 Tax=Pistacia integerrima TaxID=434235 RepID=A0ACC0XI86_9ROSI|nr:hypothetical protein Pint_11101 [Pistacia integerrima]